MVANASVSSTVVYDVMWKLDDGVNGDCLELLEQVMGMGVKKIVLDQDQEQQRRQFDFLQDLVEEQGQQWNNTGSKTPGGKVRNKR